MLRINKDGIYHIEEGAKLKVDVYVTLDDYNFIYFNRHEVHHELLSILGNNINIGVIDNEEV